MNNSIIYQFGIDEEDFEYEFDIDDAIDYIQRTLSNDEILNDYISSGLYSKLSNDDKAVLTDYNFDGTTDCLTKMIDEDKKQLISDQDIIYDLINETDTYENELREYFSDEAYDSYKESKLDDYQSRGISQKDFL